MKELNAILDAFAPGWVGSLIGLAGIAIGIFLYLKSRRRSLMGYETTGDHLLGHENAKLPPDVSVQFGKRKIPRLTRSIVIFWNCGERTIQGSDIVATDRLRIAVPEDCEVLSVAILKISRTVNSVQCVPKGRNHVNVDFDFLDHNDGAVVELLHTSDKRHLSVAGTVKGMPNGIKNFGPVARRTRTARIPIRVIPWFAVAMGVFLPIVSRVKPVAEEFSRGFLFGFGVTYAVLGFAMVWLLRRRAPRPLNVE